MSSLINANSSWILKEAYEKLTNAIARIKAAKEEHNSFILHKYDVSSIDELHTNDWQTVYNIVDISHLVNIRSPFRHTYSFKAVIDKFDYWHKIYFSNISCAEVFQILPLTMISENNGYYYNKDDIIIHSSNIIHCGLYLTIDECKINKCHINYTYSLRCKHCGLNHIQSFNSRIPYHYIPNLQTLSYLNRFLKRTFTSEKQLLSTELMTHFISPQDIININDIQFKRDIHYVVDNFDPYAGPDQYYNVIDQPLTTYLNQLILSTIKQPAAESKQRYKIQKQYSYPFISPTHRSLKKHKPQTIKSISDSQI